MVLTVTDQKIDGPVYEFVFNPGNGNAEPKDGIYYTTSSPMFSSGEDADVLYLNANYSPWSISSEDGQKVYV